MAVCIVVVGDPPKEGKIMAYKKVRIEKGRGGWGGPLTIAPTDEKPLIYCVTGGGIHPIAAKIAELTGGQAFDGFRSSAPEKKIACVVIDCGGTARIGVYPMKRIPTIDVLQSSPSGPLIQFIKEE
jgi:PTS system glucitol/sorbitol-specific IIB component/PTS system glucitol/sorbitol-specific IIC component